MKNKKLVSLLGIVALVLVGCSNPYEGHEFTFHAATAPTCSKDGNIAYCTCSYCDDYFDPVTHKVLTEDEVYIDHLGHLFTNLVASTNSTCTTHGYKAHYVCERCGAWADTSSKTMSQDYFMKPYSHTLSFVEEQKPTFTQTGVKAHYHCSSCNKNFTDNLGEREELDLRIDKLSRFDKSIEFNHTGSGLPYTYEEDENSKKVTIHETFMPVDLAGALSSLYLGLEECKNVTRRFTVSVTVTAVANGDNIGIGLYSRSPRADGGNFYALFGLKFDATRFLPGVLTYGGLFQYDFANPSSKFNMEGMSLEQPSSFVLKLIRNDEGFELFINGISAFKLAYDSEWCNRNINDSEDTRIGLMVRNNNRSRNAQGIIDNSGLRDTITFSNWSVTNNEK